jgi:cyanate permease
LLYIQITNIVSAYFFVNYSFIYFCCVLANNFCIGATFVLLPASIAKVFGTKYGTTVYSFVLSGSLASSCINIINAKYILVNYGFGISFFECFISELLCLILVSNFDEDLDIENVFYF